MKASKILWPAVIVFAACVLVGAAFSEGFSEGLDIAEVAAPIQAQQLSAEISKKVTLPRNSVVKVAFSNAEPAPPQANSLWATMFQGQPGFTADLTGRAKVITSDNAVIVPSKFTVRGTGDSETAAKIDANAKAAAVVQELEKYYANTGLLAAPPVAVVP